MQNLLIKEKGGRNKEKVLVAFIFYSFQCENELGF